MKKKKWSVLAIIALGVILILSACSDSDSSGGDGGEKDLVMGTGSQGGTYFGLGSEMANVWNNNIENINVTATESGASIENLGKIASGDFDLGMTVNLPAYNALEGVGEFEGKKVENFAFIGHIYPEVLQVITRESTGVNSIEDLKGKPGSPLDHREVEHKRRRKSYLRLTELKMGITNSTKKDSEMRKQNYKMERSMLPLDCSVYQVQASMS